MLRYIRERKDSLLMNMGTNRNGCGQKIDLETQMALYAFLWSDLISTFWYLSNDVQHSYIRRVFLQLIAILSTNFYNREKMCLPAILKSRPSRCPAPDIFILRRLVSLNINYKWHSWNSLRATQTQCPFPNEKDACSWRALTKREYD